MKQIQQNLRSGELKVANVPAPQARSGSVLVETCASLISSGTERQLIELAKASLARKAISRPDLVRRVIRNVKREGLRPTIDRVIAKLDTPVPLGYSLAGEVMGLGDRAGGFSPGDRVACAGAGFANHAEINTVPKNLTVKIPDGVDDEAASFVALGAIALQGVRLAAPTLGERVAVMGLGLIGLLTVQLLKANGCRVLGFDPDPGRVKLARELGADIAVNTGFQEAASAFTQGEGADAVLITASSKSSAPINDAAEISRLKGRIVVVGMVGMTIDREPFYKRELELKLSLSYGPGRHDPAYEEEGHDYPLPYMRWTERRNMEAFLALVADGKVTPKRLVTHRFDISEAEEAYALLEGNTPHLAIVLTYPKRADTPLTKLRLGQKHQSATTGRGVAFIGVGNNAKEVLLPALRKAGDVTLTVAVTSSGISAAHAGESYGFETVATDPNAVFADERTATAFIATRHNTHASLTAAGLRAGKNVFCEKPLATDPNGLAAVIAAANDAPGVLTVGFNRRFAPLLVQAKAELAPRLGPLVMLYRINAGTLPSDSWICRAEGGGRIIGEVCHFVDALTFLCGSLPIEARAIAAGGHPDAVSILIRFADGSTGTIVYSSLGDAGLAKEYIEVFAQGCAVCLHDFRRLDVTRRGRTSTRKAAQDKGQKALVAEFLAACRKEVPPPIPLAEMAAVTETTFAIEDSLRSGWPVPVGASGFPATEICLPCASAQSEAASAQQKALSQ